MGFFCVCANWRPTRNKKIKKNQNLFCFNSIDRYSVTGISYRWNSDIRYNGWPIGNRPTTVAPITKRLGKNTTKALKTFANFVKLDCNQCNVCFDCLIYYDSESSLTDNHTHKSNRARFRSSDLRVMSPAGYPLRHSACPT